MKKKIVGIFGTWDLSFWSRPEDVFREKLVENHIHPFTETAPNRKFEMSFGGGLDIDYVGCGGDDGSYDNEIDSDDDEHHHDHDSNEDDDDSYNDHESNDDDDDKRGKIVMMMMMMMLMLMMGMMVRLRLVVMMKTAMRDGITTMVMKVIWNDYGDGDGLVMVTGVDDDDSDA